MLRNKLLQVGRLRDTPPFRVSLFPSVRRKVSNSWSAVQDTYLSTKQIFERHRIVFTLSTSLASLLTAWAGYSLRYHHQTKVEKRLDSIEQSLKSSTDIRHEEINKIVNSGGVSMTACVATAWTTLVIGYGLGWRSGSWFARRKFQKAQVKLMEQNKLGRWQLLKKKLIQSRSLKSVSHGAGSSSGSVASELHQTAKPIVISLQNRSS